MRMRQCKLRICAAGREQGYLRPCISLTGIRQQLVQPFLAKLLCRLVFDRLALDQRTFVAAKFRLNSADDGAGQVVLQIEDIT